MFWFLWDKWLGLQLVSMINACWVFKITVIIILFYSSGRLFELPPVFCCHDPFVLSLPAVIFCLTQEDIPGSSWTFPAPTLHCVLFTSHCPWQSSEWKATRKLQICYLVSPVTSQIWWTYWRWTSCHQTQPNKFRRSFASGRALFYSITYLMAKEYLQ